MIKQIPYLPEKYLKNCKVLSNREELLNKMPKNSIFAELGVLYGYYSEKILNQCDPKELFLIDTFDMEKKQYDSILNKFKEKNEVKILKGYSWEVLKTFEDKYFDVIYIDASHDYEDVKKDSEIADLKIKDNGRIIFNDYILFNNFSSSGKIEQFGVPYVIHELCLDKSYEWEYFCLHPYMFCDVCLRRV